MAAVAFAVVLAAGIADAQEKKAPKGRTQIVFEVLPANAIVYVDGKKYGEASKLTKNGVQVSAGTHAVKLVNGGDEMEADVQVKAGTSLNFKYAFEDSGTGIRAVQPPPKDADKKAKPGKEKAKTEKQPDEEIVDLPPAKE
jgi:hypothetical protein